jgi:hypothetical protein
MNLLMSCFVKTFGSLPVTRTAMSRMDSGPSFLSRANLARKAICFGDGASWGRP